VRADATPRKSRWRRWLRFAGIALAVIVLAIQLVPVSRTNPQVAAELDAPADVHAVLKRACYDCHSNETKWPWYAYVAPVSWLVAKDVREARRRLNFSDWGNYHPDRQEHKIQEIWEQVEAGTMPLSIYVPMHPEAKLTDADRALIKQWALPIEP
jgi:hypothetical protein